MNTRENNINSEINSIWKALTNLDKADIQTAALCHAIVTVLIEKGIGSQEEIAREVGNSIPKVLTIRKEIADAISDSHAGFDEPTGNETIH